MIKKIPININLIFISIVLIQLYVLGGIITYFNLLTVTQLNILISIEIIFYLLFFRLDSFKYFPILLLALFMYILFIGLINKNSLIYIVGYELFVYFPYVAILFSFFVIKRNTLTLNFVNIFFKYLIYLQVPILILQHLYSHEIANFSNIPMIPLDAIYGTFFIKSDSSLALFVIFFSTYILFLEQNRSRNDYLVLLFSFFIILLVNSKISVVMYLLMIITYLFTRLRTGKHLIVLAFLTLLPSLIFIFSEQIHTFIININDLYISSITLAENGKDVNRIATILMILFDKLLILGNGLFDYYNYFTKEWKFFGGHSLMFSLYNDLGLIGLLISLAFLFSLISKTIRYKVAGGLYLLYIVLFSFFNVTFLDLGVLILFIYFSNILPNYELNKNRRLHEI